MIVAKLLLSPRSLNPSLLVSMLPASLDGSFGRTLPLVVFFRVLLLPLNAVGVRPRFPR